MNIQFVLAYHAATMDRTGEGPKVVRRSKV